jgi:hypothetical protein
MFDVNVKERLSVNQSVHFVSQQRGISISDLYQRR